MVESEVVKQQLRQPRFASASRRAQRVRADVGAVTGLRAQREPFGTRFTEAMHEAQQSPYRHLLEPKIGGLSIALAAMGEQFEALLDVTIVYPHGTPTFRQLLCAGRSTR